MATLANRIKELRKERDLSQEEFGKIFGIVKSTVSLYENGKSTPDDEMKKKIANYYNVSLDYLMGESNIRNPYNEDVDDKYPEIHDVEEAMKIILEQPGLMLKGTILSDESKIILANAIQMGLRTAEEIENKKNKGEDNE